MKMEIGMNPVGNLRLDGKVTITDPCYDKGTWCTLTTECEPGYYNGYAHVYDLGEWGRRVGRLWLIKEDMPQDESYSLDCIGNIGVDAGLAGFFRDKPDFPGDEWMQFLVSSGVFKNADEYDYERNSFYVVDYGLFSESGFGDGGYNVYANDEHSVFMIEFLGEEDYEMD